MEVIIVVLFALIAGFSSGCASKQYIMKNCGDVVDRKTQQTDGREVCEKNHWWE